MRASAVVKRPCQTLSGQVISELLVSISKVVRLCRYNKQVLHLTKDFD